MDVLKIIIMKTKIFNRDVWKKHSIKGEMKIKGGDKVSTMKNEGKPNEQCDSHYDDNNDGKVNCGESVCIVDCGA